MAYRKLALGIDIGGSGIKAAPVDCEKGLLLQERHRIPTPEQSTPKAVAKVVAEMVEHFKWKGPIGIGFPSMVLNGVVRTASNIHKSWIGVKAEKLFSESTGLPVKVLNDADAAGLAEAKYGYGKENEGVVMVLTVGTGVGSAIVHNGILLPNTELGHLQFGGMTIEKFVSDRTRKMEDLSWEQWGGRFNSCLAHLEFLFSPELFIIGGGASKKFEKFSACLSTRASVQPAKLGNEAGIIGAACVASEK